MTEQWQELKETITEMRDNGGTGTQQEVCKFLTNYMEILEKQMQQPCEDCISRETVINRIANTCFWLSADNWEELIKCINSISSVTPKAKIGWWIDIQYFKADDTYYRPKCPFCGIEPKEYSNYCPNCGAKMEEVEEWQKID